MHLTKMDSDMRNARRSQSLAARERDAALGRVGRTRRWVILGAAGLTAGFAALVSSVAPGKTLKAGHATVRSEAASTTSPRSTGSTKMPPLASPSQLGLQGPGQPPQSAPAQTTPDPSQAPAQTTPDPSQAPAQTTPDPSQAPAQTTPATSGGS
jgi:hypothetical protein